MVTAPMITSSVNVNLPQANAKPAPSDMKPITISVNAQGAVFLNNTQVELPNLVATLQQASQNNPDQRIFVRGDKDVPYGTMIQVMATITQGGFTKVALLAQPGGQ
jgi:biopolymer transport protein TolR